MLPARALAFVVLLSLPAWAQEGNQFEGLDLTEPRKDEPAKPPPAEKPAERPPEDKPAARPAPATSSTPPGAPIAERDVTQEDRVKSVQRKLYLKRLRFELAPSVVVNLNDPFYTRIGAAGRLAFYPADSLAIALRFTWLNTLPSDDVVTAKRNLQSRIFYSVPTWTAMADLEWSPLYGKVAFFNSILHFDGSLIAGGGAVYTETSAARGSVNPAFDLGVGLRFVARDFLAVNVSLINTTYVDTPTGSTKASTQNLLLVYAGLSIFLPFKSTFREDE